MRWTVALSETARNDFQEIVGWTEERFGDRQAAVYAETLITVIKDLHAGPQQPGVRVREDIGKGIHTLHVARHGRKGRHFVMFRVAAHGEPAIEVLRLLHDAMDLPRHLPPSQ